MARRRMIDPSYWDDENVGALSSEARLLLLCCISQADDYGKLTGSANSLKKIAFGFTDTTTAQVEDLLAEIAKNVNGFCRYEVDGKQYIALLHWYRYQRVDHAQTSTIPDPPRPFDPIEYQKNQKRSENDSENDSENHTGQLTNKQVSNELSKPKEITAACLPAKSMPSKTESNRGATYVATVYCDLVHPLTANDSIFRNAYGVAIEMLEYHPRLHEKGVVVALCHWCQYKMPTVGSKPLSYIKPYIIDCFNERRVIRDQLSDKYTKYVIDAEKLEKEAGQ